MILFGQIPPDEEMTCLDCKETDEVCEECTGFADKAMVKRACTFFDKSPDRLV
jgi:hypothetical protein